MGLCVGTDWKSTRLIDYYYGVSQRDTDFTELYFNGKSGWQTYMSINLQKPINANWSWLVNVAYRRLPSSLISTPLAEQNNIHSAFLGVAYRFKQTMELKIIVLVVGIIFCSEVSAKTSAWTLQPNICVAQRVGDEC